MDQLNTWRWPVEMLGRILHFLAMDGAACTWTHLAYLTHKNDALKKISKKMERPLVLRVGFGEQDRNKTFLLPFRRATVAQIEIDWGDGTPLQIITEVGEGKAEHEYKAAGEYTVRVFPHHSAATEAAALDGRAWLDHLGLDIFTDDDAGRSWWARLRSLDTLGSLGISSLENLFYNASKFNLSLSTLDVSQIIVMQSMFYCASSFDQPIGRWNVSNVTDMCNMFTSCESFNQDISRWDVSHVQYMDGLLAFATTFNKPLGDWDTSNVIDMSDMFAHCREFNQDISRWNVSKVQDMARMFLNAQSFNQPIGSWNVSNVKNMVNMFDRAAAFNQPIGGWDVSSVQDMYQMFANAAEFAQDIGMWNISDSNVRMTGMFEGAFKFPRSCTDRWNLSDEQRDELFYVI